MEPLTNREKEEMQREISEALCVCDHKRSQHNGFNSEAMFVACSVPKCGCSCFKAYYSLSKRQQYEQTYKMVDHVIKGNTNG